MPRNDRRVRMRRGSRSSVIVGVVVGILLAPVAIGAELSSGRFRDPEAGPAVAFAVVVVAAVLLTVIWFARPRTGALWDLDRRTITSRGETIPFAAIRRVIVCTGAKGYYGLMFFGDQGHLPRLSIPVTSRRHPSLGAWQAVRELLASPHTPTLEGYGTPRVSAKDFETKPPVSATSGPTAVTILDGQLAWIAEGGDPRSSEAPLEQFRLSGYHGL